MGESHEKIVNFAYCRFCEHKNEKETSEVCSDCLENPVNVDSQRPVRFKDNGSLARVERAIKKNISKEEKGE